LINSSTASSETAMSAKNHGAKKRRLSNKRECSGHCCRHSCSINLPLYAAGPTHAKLGHRTRHTALQSSLNNLWAHGSRATLNQNSAQSARNYAQLYCLNVASLKKWFYSFSDESSNMLYMKFRILDVDICNAKMWPFHSFPLWKVSCIWKLHFRRFAPSVYKVIIYGNDVKMIKLCWC